MGGICELLAGLTSQGRDGSRAAPKGRIVGGGQCLMPMMIRVFGGPGIGDRVQGLYIRMEGDL
ncbi:hypothetical protein LIA77_01902 [Sarocladium implicatum]|nr:hypothetical protein LIA77_01902 [Sarocladium implicatum]